MPRGSKKPRTKSKAKKTSAAKAGKGGKKGSAGGAASKPKVGGTKPAKPKKSMTVADLKRELQKMLTSLSSLNAYFAKYPDPPAASTTPGAGIEIGPQATGDRCAPATDGPGIGNPVALGDACAPPNQQTVPGSNWYVFKKTLARMTVTVSTLIGMLSGLNPKMKI